MDARYYDPLIGRFYSNDPIGFRDVHSFNRYAYANNNPYKYTDPTGMCSEGGKDGCTITEKTSGQIIASEVDPTSPSSVNGHAMTGDGSAKVADFAAVGLEYLGLSIQKYATSNNSQLANAISSASNSGKTQIVNINGLKASKGFNGDTSLSQKGAIGRFSVSISGLVNADKNGNWSLTGLVTGEPDRQDYPFDSSRTGTASALTAFGAGIQGQLGGKNYDIFFAGSQTISVKGN